MYNGVLQSEDTQSCVDTIQHKCMVFVSKFGIALCYVIYSILFDLVLFANNGWQLTSNFWVSVFLLIIFAGLINTLSSNMIKMIIFGILLGLGLFFTICNIASFDSLGEIFSLELFGKIVHSLQQQKLVDFSAISRVVTVSILYCLFWVCAIIINKFANGLFVNASTQSGRRIITGAKSKVASLLVCVLMMPIIALVINSNEKPSNYILNDVYNPKIINQEFDVNRVEFYKQYGTMAFVVRNLLNIFDWNVFKSDFSNDVFSRKLDKYTEQQQTEDYVLGLGSDYNLIMLMMETVEYDCINPILTPNLWWIKEHSTWVDNYYAIERTTVTENVALTGSNLFGFEISYMYKNTYLPQSLPHIFGRMGYDTVDAYHNYDNSAYDRTSFFAKANMGFDNYYDMQDGDDLLYNDFRLQNDKALFERGLSEQGMAPSDKTFFNYILNVAPHGTHFGSPRMIYDGLDLLGRPQYLPALSHIEDDLDWVLYNQDILSMFYPRMYEDDAVNHASIAWMVALRDYDDGVGLLLEHLRNTPDLARYPDGSVPLIDTTALVVFSDHHNYATNGHGLNQDRGGVLNRRQDSSNLPNGERLNLMIYNPRDVWTIFKANYRYNNDYVITIDNIYDKIEQGQLDMDNLDYTVGRQVHKFASNADIYATVCQLFGISTSARYTLGSSVLLQDRQSVGINYGNTSFFLQYQLDDGETKDKDIHLTNLFNNLNGIIDFDIRYNVAEYLEYNTYTLLYLQQFYKNNSFGNTNIETMYMMKSNT
ncbi:MAG: sulfatase-like hydrolase/transferase [Clostridiales bacterium]|jgi:hypothetical protein|nr:sulfatase-like hydrolase/transferase [Clostridiales bacterium]